MKRIDRSSACSRFNCGTSGAQIDYSYRYVREPSRRDQRTMNDNQQTRKPEKRDRDLPCRVGITVIIRRAIAPKFPRQKTKTTGAVKLGGKQTHHCGK